MTRLKYSLNDVKIAVEQNVSMAGVLRQLGLRPVGGNYRTINRIIKVNGFNTTHFTGQGWNVGLKFKPNTGMPDNDVFTINSNYKCSWRLREKYKRMSGKDYCERCGLSMWLGKPIPLEIHHVNGNNLDNRLENLQLLCPNCHALTSNYRGKAHLSALSERRDVECRKFKETVPKKFGGNLEPSPKNGEGAETRHDTPTALAMAKE